MSPSDLAPSSEPGSGCSAPAAEDHALQERRAKGEKAGKGGDGEDMGGERKKRHGRPVSFHNSGRKKRKRVVTWLSLFLQFKV